MILLALLGASPTNSYQTPSLNITNVEIIKPLPFAYLSTTGDLLFSKNDGALVLSLLIQHNIMAGMIFSLRDGWNASMAESDGWRDRYTSATNVQAKSEKQQKDMIPLFIVVGVGILATGFVLGFGAGK